MFFHLYANFGRECNIDIVLYNKHIDQSWLSFFVINNKFPIIKR